MWPAIKPRSRSGRNSGYRLAASIERINADRTAGSGGNGFSLSDKASGSIAFGKRVIDLGGDRARDGLHQPRPPQRTAAAPAKSPAWAKAAIMTTSPALS